jgi:hypothetical protein
MQEPERFRKNIPVRLVTLLGNKKSGATPFPLQARPLIGVLEGTGIGPEIIGATLQILKSVGQLSAIGGETR